MADRSQQLVLEALARAAAEPDGLPLFGSRTNPGWFANTPAGKQAALVCQERGFVRKLRSETRGKTVREICAPSEAGLDFLRHLTQPRTRAPRALPEVILARLEQWRASGTLDDCPLPRLFRAAAEEHPGLTIGQFHDALRQLHAGKRLYLHPWTGPLYQIPEPAFAVLVGHEVAYYASLPGGSP